VRLHAVANTGPRLLGGIDLGGSKIESRLFDGNLNELARRRVPTSKTNYDELVDAVCAELEWLEQQAGSPVPVGIGIPGVIDRSNGVAITANLPATGHRLGADLSARFNRSIPVENDCKCFALSEAVDGAGRSFRTVFGLVLGTGIGGGVCVDGKLASGLNNLAGEVGHFGLPAPLLEQEKLPIVSCGCGRVGCYETLLSGPGMTRLGTHYAHLLASPSEIVALASQGNESMSHAYRVWLMVLAEMIRTVQLTVDPDCIVLGGGLSQISGLGADLESTFIRHRIAGVRSPQFAIAKFGDCSGVRGAAMLARNALGGAGMR
jgi:predicted NBD/HSP70 family sugar kinase